MAYSLEQWERAKAYYEAGTHSLSEIQEIIGISKSKISEKAKKEQWERGRNSDYIEAKVLIAEKKGNEKRNALEILDNIADEQIRHKKLINSNAELLASHIPKVLKSLTTKTINDKGEEEELYAVDARTIRELAEANDKLSITLKVNERHAPKQDINLTNAQQNNEQKIIKVVYE